LFAFETPKIKKVLFRIEIGDIVSIGDFKIKRDATEEWLILLQLTFNRTIVLGSSNRFEDKMRWRDLVSVISKFPKYAQIPKSKSSTFKPDMEIHNDHFLYDQTPSESRSNVRSAVLEQIHPDVRFQEPVAYSLPGNHVVYQVSSSADHAIAVTVDGKAFVWGKQNADHPLLGLGLDGPQTVLEPVELSTPFGSNEKVSSAVCGMLTSALISTKGQVALWGQVIQEQKRKVLLEKVGVPTLFGPMRNKFVSSIATYKKVCFAIIRVPGLDDVTEVWSWGNNSSGLLGHAANFNQKFLSPSQVEGLRNETIVNLSVSDTHVICVNAKGEVYVWGKNYYESPNGDVPNVLGLPSKHKTTRLFRVPKKLDHFGKGILAKKAQAGSYHSIVLTHSQQVFTWGFNGNTDFLAHPLEKLPKSEGLAYLDTPTPIVGMSRVEDIHTNGLFSIAKTESGDVYSWGQKEKSNPSTPLQSYLSLGDTFVMRSSAFGPDRAVVVKGSTYAWVAYEGEKKLISASWHVTVGHLKAFASRFWNLPTDSFVILDALGKDCAISDPTNRLIQNMILRDVTPAFIVTNLESLLKLYRPYMWLRKGTIHWAHQESLLSLLFMFPPSILSTKIGTVPANFVPQVEMNYHDVFFLTYSDRLSLKSEEIFDFLIESYENLSTHVKTGRKSKIMGRLSQHPKLERGGTISQGINEEPWIPSSLDRLVVASIQKQLPRTRMGRVLLAIESWLKIRPQAFFESSELLGDLLSFLQQECDNQLLEISTAALRVRRMFFLKMSTSGGGVSNLNIQPKRKDLSEMEGSVLLQFPAKFIAEQLTWVDAHHIFGKVSTVDILNQRMPKSVVRHRNVSFWFEKEILENQKHLQKLIDKIIEIMWHLASLGNFFTYTSLYGTLSTKPIRAITDHVWEKGTRLGNPALGYWKQLSSPEKHEPLMNADKFFPFFGPLQEPKLPFIGYLWKRFIYLGESYKFENQPSKPSSSSLSFIATPSSSLVLFERCQAEAELVFWCNRVFVDAMEKGCDPDPDMIPFLLNVSGFRQDPKEHRQIADNFRLTGCQPASTVLGNSKEISSSDFGDDVDEENSDDIETVLLTGRAAFVSLSNRLRSELWDQWLSLIRQEATERKATQLSGLQAKQFSELFIESGNEKGEKGGEKWSKVYKRLLGMKKSVSRVVKGPFPLGSFVHLLLQSDALEVTAESLLDSFPDKSTLEKLKHIIAMILGEMTLSSLLLSAIEEMHNFETIWREEKQGTRGSFQHDDSFEAMSRDLIWKIISLIKIYQPFLYDFQSIRVEFLKMDSILTDITNFLADWRLYPIAQYREIEDQVWDCYTLLDTLNNAINDSEIWSLSRLPEELEELGGEEEGERGGGERGEEGERIDYHATLSQFAQFLKVLEGHRHQKSLSNLNSHSQLAKELKSLLESQMSDTQKRISLTKKENKNLENRNSVKNPLPENYDELKDLFVTKMDLFMGSLERSWRGFDVCPIRKLFSQMKEVIIPNIEKEILFCHDQIENINEITDQMREFVKHLLLERDKMFKLNSTMKLMDREKYANLQNRMETLGLEGGETINMSSIVTEMERRGAVLKSMNRGHRRTPSNSTRNTTKRIRPPVRGGRSPILKKEFYQKEE